MSGLLNEVPTLPDLQLVEPRALGDVFSNLSITSSKRRTSLPTETLSEIFRYAWRTACRGERWEERRELYYNLATADPRFRSILSRVILEYVAFTCLTKDAPRQNQFYYKIASNAKADGYPGKPFHGAHVRIIEPGSTPIRPLKGSWEWSDWVSGNHVIDRLGDSWPHNSPSRAVKHIQARVMDCTSVTLVSLFDPDPKLLQTLASFSSLTHVYLDCDWQHRKGRDPAYDSHEDLKFALPSVVFLRIRRYRSSTRELFFEVVDTVLLLTNSLKPGIGDEFQSSVWVMRAFINVRHLQVDNPSLLKDLECPPLLDTLTLEARPRSNIAGREPYSSVLEYNIPSALSRSLKVLANRSCPQRKIIVHTGITLPYGWEIAKRACEQANVQLLRVVSY